MIDISVSLATYKRWSLLEQIPWLRGASTPRRAMVRGPA
jgi:hypothetical protein